MPFSLASCTISIACMIGIDCPLIQIRLDTAWFACTRQGGALSYRLRKYLQQSCFWCRSPRKGLVKTTIICIFLVLLLLNSMWRRSCASEVTTLWRYTNLFIIIIIIITLQWLQHFIPWVKTLPDSRFFESQYILVFGQFVSGWYRQQSIATVYSADFVRPGPQTLRRMGPRCTVKLYTYYDYAAI